MLKVPFQTPISTIDRILEEQKPVRESIDEISRKSKSEALDKTSQSVLSSTQFKSSTAASHDIFKRLISETENRKADMMVMGWQGGFSLGRIYNSPVQRIIKNL